jgi:hypothetical protein
MWHSHGWGNDPIVGKDEDMDASDMFWRRLLDRGLVEGDNKTEYLFLELGSLLHKENADMECVKFLNHFYRAHGKTEDTEAVMEMMEALRDCKIHEQEAKQIDDRIKALCQKMVDAP